MPSLHRTARFARLALRLPLVALMVAAAFIAMGQSPALAQAPAATASHAIAHQLDSCMEASDWSPEEMLDCAEAAEPEWQAEVERLTARLGSVLGADAGEALKDADSAWRVSRDADLSFIDAYHAQLEEAELGDPALVPLARQLYRNALLESRVDRLQPFLDGLEAIEGPVPDMPIPPP